MAKITLFALKLGIAILALITVIWGYLFFRLDPPVLLQSLQPAEIFQDQAHWFGSVPSLLYTFAVGILIGSFTSSSGHGQVHCLIWTFLALALELTQHHDIAGSISVLVARLFPGPVTEILLPYWSRGSFDYLDLVATAIGGLVALAILRYPPRGSEAGHD
jgi:hypothetical protein